MSLTLYYHPLASFCHKVLIALYENQTAFEGRIVDLGDERSADRPRAVSWESATGFARIALAGHRSPGSKTARFVG